MAIQFNRLKTQDVQLYKHCCDGVVWSGSVPLTPGVRRWTVRAILTRPHRVVQCSILGDEICAILENGGDNGENQWELEGHPADCSLSRNERNSQQFRYRVQ